MIAPHRLPALLAALTSLAACATPAEALHHRRYEPLCRDARRPAGERHDAAADALFARVTLEGHDLGEGETRDLFGDLPTGYPPAVGWLVVATDLPSLRVGPVGMRGDEARDAFASMLPPLPVPEAPLLPPGPLALLAPGPMPPQPADPQGGLLRGLLALLGDLAEVAGAVAIGVTARGLEVGAGVVAGERVAPTPIDPRPFGGPVAATSPRAPRLQGAPVLPPEAWQAVAAEPLERHRRALEEHTRRQDDRARRIDAAARRLGATCITGAGRPPCRLLVAMAADAETHERRIPLVADLDACAVPLDVDWGHLGFFGPRRVFTAIPSLPTAAPPPEPAPAPWRDRLPDLQRLASPYRAFRQGDAPLVCRLRLKPSFDHQRFTVIELAVGALAGRAAVFGAASYDTRGGAHYFGVTDPIAPGDHIALAAHDWVDQFGVLHLVADRPRLTAENDAIAVECRVRLAAEPRP